MTSSLVGSEMCIRDRLVAATAANGELVAHQTERQRTEKKAAVITKMTVSYTHLTLPTICSV
eukprot:3002349-Prorocentrum_lima.AAC.1